VSVGDGDVPKKWLGCRLVEQSPKIRKKEDKGTTYKRSVSSLHRSQMVFACLHLCQAKREERGRDVHVRACDAMEMGETLWNCGG